MFTDTEKLELKKLAQAQDLMGAINVRIASNLRQKVVPLSTQVAAWAPHVQFRLAVDDCGAVMEYLQGTASQLVIPQRYAIAGMGRAQQIAGAFAKIDSAIGRLQAARPAFVALAALEPAQAANVADVDRVIGWLQSFDRTLPYAGPQNLNVPLVGNHGDLELSLNSHSAMHFYMSRSYYHLLIALQEVDGATTVGSPLPRLYEHAYGILLALGRYQQLHAATWPALFGVILDRERPLIETDQSLGAQIRGFEFFVFQRLLELLGADGYNFKKPLISGRQLVQGMGYQAYAGQESAYYFSDIVRNDPAIDKTEAIRRWKATDDLIVSLAAAWVYVDKGRGHYMGIHYALTGTPPPADGALAAALAKVAELEAKIAAAKVQAVEVVGALG